jgi:hypothetical protein
MKFCPICKFMIYTKMENDNSKKTLKYYCKNCSWKDESESDLHLVYKRVYKKDYIAESINLNKYIIYDNTLARVNCECPNTECCTKLNNLNNSVLIENIPDDDNEKEFKDRFSELDNINNIKRFRLNKAIITFKNKNNLDLNEIKNKIKIDTNDYNILIKEKFNVPKNEVVYIKYDHINMKYLYLCVNCGNSWKKN